MTLAAAEELASLLPPLLAAAQRVAACAAAGLHGRRRSGPGETFWQYRAALPGDSANAIDWRRSARSQDFFVRETEWAAAQSVTLWRDGSGSMNWRSSPDLPHKRERAEILTVALAALLLRGGERVGVLGGGQRPVSGVNALPRLAEALLSAPADLSAAAVPRHGELVLVSDFLTPPEMLEQRLRALAAQGAMGHMVQVLDPAEQALPYEGRIRFSGLEGEGDILLRRVEDVRAAYADKMAAHGEALALAARRLGWSFTAHDTSRSPQTALLALHARLSGRR